MLKNRIKTIKIAGEIFHDYLGITVQCTGQQDCPVCRGEQEFLFQEWERSIPYRIPPKGRKYKKESIQACRGKTLVEICYTCKKVPCYICKRGECKEWQKETHRKGQEEGCSAWENGRCIDFVCERGLISKSWHRRSDVLDG